MKNIYEQIIGDVASECVNTLVYTDGRRKKKVKVKHRTKTGSEIVSLVDRLVEEHRLKREAMK